MTRETAHCFLNLRDPCFGQVLVFGLTEGAFRPSGAAQLKSVGPITHPDERIGPCGLHYLEGNGREENIHQVFYYSIFPNMLLSLHPEYVMVHQLWPQSPERTLITCDWLFHPDAFTRKDFKPEDAIEFWDMTNKQDWHVCELSQQGIASRVYEPGPYSSRESIPAAWDRYYLSVMD